MIVEEYFKVFFIFAAALSFLMAMLLFFYPVKKFATQVFGIISLVWGFLLLGFSIGNNEFYISYPHLFALDNSLTLLIFPLLYIYIKSYLDEEFRIIYRNLIHFIPFIAYLVILSPFFFQSTEDKAFLIKEGLPIWVESVIYYCNVFVIVQGLIYTIFSIKILVELRLIYQVKWFRHMIIVNTILWITGTTASILGELNFESPIDPFIFYYIIITILFIRSGYFSIKYPELIFVEKNQKFEYLKQASKPHKTTLVAKDKNDLKKIIEYLEIEKPFLNNELSLADLVENTTFTKHRISELLNSGLNKSFYDVINDYRVKEAIKLLDEGKYKEFTLEHISEQSGFNSKATFYRSFKKAVGETPSSYIKSLDVDES